MDGAVEKSHQDFEHSLELARFAAAHVRRNLVCSQRHREKLRIRGETERRLGELASWSGSTQFTTREKAAMSLSESISLKHPREMAERVLHEARLHFDVAEIVSLSMAVVAINDWLDLHSEPQIRVLIVEDSPADQELLRRQLRQTHMEEHVIFVSDAREALDLLRSCQDGRNDWQFIAAFLDIHLPGINGVELLQHIRTMPGMEDLPVIIMTSSPSPRDMEECHRLKAAGYVQKPVTFTTFSKAVANIFHPCGGSQLQPAR